MTAWFDAFTRREIEAAEVHDLGVVRFDAQESGTLIVDAKHCFFSKEHRQVKPLMGGLGSSELGETSKHPIKASDYRIHKFPKKQMGSDFDPCLPVTILVSCKVREVSSPGQCLQTPS